MNARSRPARVAVRVGAALAALSFLAAACGDDDDEAATTEAPPASETPATDAPVPPPDTFGGSIAAEDTEVCAIAQEMADSEEFPSEDVLTRYQAAAPPEIAAQVATAAGPLVAAGEDQVALMAAFGDDVVEEAITEINAWETAHCGIDHSQEDDPGEGATREIDDSATAVDVAASEFTFEVGEVTAGPTSFVLTNAGEQAHHLVLFKLAAGVALDEALASDSGEGIEGTWSTGVAAPGGGDEEYLTFDLAPGNYGLVCFLPDTDGTPHAFKGMAVPVTVA